jgi:hypothetical protein
VAFESSVHMVSAVLLVSFGIVVLAVTVTTSVSHVQSCNRIDTERKEVEQTACI